MSVMICDYLTDEEKEQVQELHRQSISHIPEGGTSSLSLLLTESEEDEYDDTFFVLYLSDETEEILSFASVFCPDGWTAEICGFTAPKNRHKGYFSQVLKAAEEESLERFGDIDFIYQCLSDDPDTLGFLSSHGMTCTKKECLMYLPDEQSVREPETSALSIEGPVRGAVALKSLVIPIFPDMNMSAYDYLKTVQDDPATESYRILKKDGTPVGLFHLTKAEKVCYLMGFGILPSHRRQHFAEEALYYIIRSLKGDRQLYLQVTDQNTAAYSLYCKTGFKIKVSVDYYSR